VCVLCVLHSQISRRFLYAIIYTACNALKLGFRADSNHMKYPRVLTAEADFEHQLLIVFYDKCIIEKLTLTIYKMPNMCSVQIKITGDKS
jgi:hypothetical protein